MERKYNDVRYVDGKRESDITETTSFIEDTRKLGDLYVQLSNAMMYLETNPNDEYWIKEKTRITLEIELYEGFVKGYENV